MLNFFDNLIILQFNKLCKKYEIRCLQYHLYETKKIKNFNDLLILFYNDDKSLIKTINHFFAYNKHNLNKTVHNLGLQFSISIGFTEDELINKYIKPMKFSGIKVKGKNLETNEYVYGLPLNLIEDSDKIDGIKVDFNTIIKVDPESVGVYIGINDKDGNEIYSEDIVKAFDGKKFIIGKVRKRLNYYFWTLDNKTFDELSLLEIIKN